MRTGATGGARPARADRLHDHDRPPLRLPRRRRRPARRRDRGRPHGRAALPAHPRLDGPRGEPGRAARRTTWSRRSTRSSRPTAEAIDRHHDPSPDSMLRIGVAPVLAVLGHRRPAGAVRGARPRQGRAAAHPPRRDHRRGRLLPRAVRLLAGGVRRLAGLARAGRVARPRRPPRRPGDRGARRLRDRRGPLPVVERPARRRHLPDPRPARRRASRSGSGSTAPRPTRRPRWSRSCGTRCSSPAPVGGPQALTVRDGLELATLGGARVLGWDDQIGSLEPGKLADVALWRVDTAAHAGIADPVAALVLGTPPPLELLLVQGRAVVRHDAMVDGRRGTARGRRARRVRTLLAGRRDDDQPRRRRHRPRPARPGHRGRRRRVARRGRTASSRSPATFAYASDLWMDGMLWGVTLRSPHPHARILARRPHRGPGDRRGSSRCSPTRTCPARSTSVSSTRTSRSSRSTWSATRASRSRWSPPTTRRPPGRPPRRSSSSTRSSSRSSTPSRRCDPDSPRLHPQRQPGAARQGPHRRPAPDRRRRRVGRLPGGDAGPGLPRARVGPRRPGRRRRRRPPRRHPVAARRPAPGLLGPRPGTRPGPAARSPASAAPSAAARTSRCTCTAACSRCTPAGRSRWSTTARSPSSATCTGTPPRCTTSTAPTATAGSSTPAPTVHLDGGAYASSTPAVVGNAGTMGLGPYDDPPHPHGLLRRLHQQPALRRDARLRLGADRVRRRGDHGPARRRGRPRPGGDPGPQRLPRRGRARPPAR